MQGKNTAMSAQRGIGLAHLLSCVLQIAGVPRIKPLRQRVRSANHRRDEVGGPRPQKRRADGAFPVRPGAATVVKRVVSGPAHFQETTMFYTVFNELICLPSSPQILKISNSRG